MIGPDVILDGRYRLVRRLGQGGFGDVWHAVELLPDGAPLREVALKLLLPELAIGSWTEEAKLVASFSHPSLVTIFAAGILDERTPFVAMELLDGRSLHDELRAKKTLPWRAALHYAREIAAALDVIHKKGVIHLDLKPANVFITRERRVKVLDFGIAKRADTVRTLPTVVSGIGATAVLLDEVDPFQHTAAVFSAGGPVVGTPGFVAPEVLDQREPTPASDAYALGAMIVVLTSGRLPQWVSTEVGADSNEEVFRTWWNELRESTRSGKLSDSADALPRGVRDLVWQLLSVDPEKRVTGAGLLAMVEEACERPHGLSPAPYRAREIYDATAEGALPGRAHEIDRLRRVLGYESMVCVHGPARSGKRSLVLAGIVPALAKARLDDMDDWIALSIGPDDAPGHLEEALRAAGVAHDGAVDDATTDDADRPTVDGGSDAIAALEQFVRARNVGVAVVLVDLVTALDRGPASALVERLVALPATLGLRVVAIVDTTQVDALLADARVGDRVRAALQFVGVPRGAEAKELALAPLDVRGLAVRGRERLVEAVHAELDGAETLVFLSCALSRWAEAPALDGARFQADRHVERVLHATLDEALDGLDADTRPRAEEVLLALATTDGEPTTLDAEAIARAAGSEADAASVMARLTSAQIVRRVRGSFTVSDPRLLGAPRLAQLRLAAMDRLALYERVQDRAERWDRGGRAARDLDDGALNGEIVASDLSIARFSQLEREFLRESNRRGRRRRALTALSLALILASVVGFFLFQKAQAALRRTAEENERRAERAFYQAALLARARRSTDPYERLAYLVEAEKSGSEDAVLAPEVAETAKDLVPAYFLSQARVDALRFPWDARFLVGIGPSGNLATIDLYPPVGEALVFESAELDAAALPSSVLPRKPRTTELALHDGPIVEYAPFAFDTSLVTRSAHGEVAVVRVSGDGVALAARFGERCDGRVAVARRAAIVACPTSKGVVVFDVAGDRAVHLGRSATFVAVSDDGRFVAGAAGKSLFVARTDGSLVLSRELAGDVSLAAFRPDGEVLAVVEASADTSSGTLGLLSFAAGGLDTAIDAPTIAVPAALRWDPAGRFVMVCDARGGRAVHRLDPDLDAASIRSSCHEASEGTPRRIEDRDGFVGLSGAAMGVHLSHGGFELDEGRYVTSSLLLVSRSDRRLDGLLRFHADVEPGETLRDIVRTETTVFVEASQTIRARSIADGRSYDIGKGRLLGACPDGAVLAFRSEAAHTIVTELRANAEVARVAREPGLVIGASPDCQWLVTQRLDGSVVAHGLGAAAASRELGRLEGYVYLARPGAAEIGSADEIVVASSDGAISRLSPARDKMLVVASALPRARALGVDPTNDDLFYVDAAGLSRVPLEGRSELVLGSSPLASWNDIVVLPSGGVAYLASSTGVEVFDLRQRELVQRFSWSGVGRFVRWDAGGSIAFFDDDVEGASDVQVLPRGDLLGKIGVVASNLVTRDGKLFLR